MSYEDYLDYWMTNYCYFNVKYATIASYLNIIKNHLKPELGMYKLTQLDSYTIQNYINKLYKEKDYSKHYLKGILKLIKGSLKYACYTVNFIMIIQLKEYIYLNMMLLLVIQHIFLLKKSLK